MKEIDIKIKLPESITVHIPTFSDIKLEDLGNIIAKNGINLIKEIIQDRVLEAFVKEHESFIQEKVAELLEEKRAEIKKVFEV